MTCLSFPANDEIPLVLDTSVLINLHASTFGKEILQTIPNDILIPEIVSCELEHQTSRINGEYEFVHDLAASSTVTIAKLDDSQFKLFERLVTQSPSIDDGEAATIAIGAQHAALPVIDDKKGRQRAATELSDTPCIWSLDLFLHPRVKETFDGKSFAEAIYLALREGRMRVHEDHCDTVLNIIGHSKALNCTCLPGFKVRRLAWEKDAYPEPDETTSCPWL